MAMYLTVEEHDANPPSTWVVEKAAARLWELRDRAGAVIDSFPTRKAAEAARTDGFGARLYEQEGRWMRGYTPPGRRPFSDCEAGMRAASEQNAARRRALLA